MKRSIALVVVFLLLLSCVPRFPHLNPKTFIPTVFAQDVPPPQNQTLMEYTLDIPCYQPSKITFNYGYTNYNSISEISTVGQSLYKYSGGPNFMEFIATDVDDYMFDLELRYTEPANQSILVGIWSGIQPMQGLDYKASFERVVFHIRLRVTQQPQIPSGEQLANLTITQVTKALADQYNAMLKVIESQNATIMTVTLVSIALFGGFLAALFIMLKEMRRIRKVTV